MHKGQPEAGKVYCLIGGSDKPSIANGNTWQESEVEATIWTNEKIEELRKLKDEAK